jgi:heme exporter protein C
LRGIKEQEMHKAGKYSKVLLLTAFFLVIVDLAVIFFYAPLEASQGIIQKIFYIHVPSAFAMYLGFAAGMVFSIMYLLRRSNLNDLLAYSAVETGFVFSCCVLISGPLWAKGTWGKFWDFDPRLTATLIVWFIYFSYLLIRKYYGNTSRGKVFSAVIAVIGALDIPVIHYSVKLWRGVHPNVLAERSKGSIPPEMVHTLIFSVFVFIVLYAAVFLYKFSRETDLNRERISI